MISRILGLISFVAFGLCKAQELTLPITICHRDSADHSTCLKDAIQEAWPRFIQGFPEADFPILDPLIYKSHHAKYDNGDIHADIEAMNIITIGFKDTHFVFAKTHFNDNVFRVEIDSEISKVFNDGDLKMIGTVGPFKINSTGHFNITSTDLKVRWIITGHVVDDKWVVERFRAIPTITGMKLHLTGLLDSEEIEKLVNEFVNEYWPILYRAMGGVIIDTWDPWLVDIVNSVFSKVSFSKVFPKFYELCLANLKTTKAADDRWIVECFRATPTVMGMKTYLTGFLDSKELNDLMHKYINEYWPALYRAMGSMVIDTWYTLFVQSLIFESFLFESISKIELKN